MTNETISSVLLADDRERVSQESQETAQPESDVRQLDPITAERIIEAFRQGAVPTEHLQLFCLGRERWLQSVRKDLDFVAKGGSKVRFLLAPYGGGKTHFLMLAKEIAASTNFLFSYVELNSREAPFDRFEIIFTQLMRGITLPDGGNTEQMLEDWAREFPQYNPQQVEASLRLMSPSLDFRAALRSALKYANSDTPEHRIWMQGILSWLQGYRLTPELSRATGIRSRITITNVSELLGSFLRFVRASGYGGLVLLLDEAEDITSLAQSRRRNEANQNIRKLLDNTDEHSGLYVLFGTTPAFLTDPKNGAQSYPPLWNRIKNVINLIDTDLEQASSRTVVITLPPFDQATLEDLAVRIAELHSHAYQWNASEYCNHAYVSNLAALFLERSDPRMVRSFVRGLVYALDIAEETRQPTVLEDILE